MLLPEDIVNNVPLAIHALSLAEAIILELHLDSALFLFPDMFVESKQDAERSFELSAVTVADSDIARLLLL